MKTHKTNDRLVAVMYLLLRDDVTAGRLETIVEGVEGENVEWTLSNNFIAEYAEELANRIRNQTAR